MLFLRIQGLKSDGKHSGGAQEWARLAADHLLVAASSVGVPPVCERPADAKIRSASRIQRCRRSIFLNLSRDLKLSVGANDLVFFLCF